MLSYSILRRGKSRGDWIKLTTNASKCKTNQPNESTKRSEINENLKLTWRNNGKLQRRLFLILTDNWSSVNMVNSV
ncbi:MAG: hypothetical protein ACTS4Y_01120 [Candidatus Hodgkinia cicadicola]